MGDDSEGITNGIGAGSASGHGTIDRPFCLKPNRYATRREICQDGWNRKGGNLARTFTEKELFRFFQYGQPSDGGADDDTRALGKVRMDG